MRKGFLGVIALLVVMAVAACIPPAAVPPAPDSPRSTLPDLGPAAEFTGITHWLNGGPLALDTLRGKVVLVDFWTLGCYNCRNTLPYITSWYEKYKDEGLVVIGVHTPEFPYERKTGNVQAALVEHGITYPVAQDNDYATWNAYGNRYWPAAYFVDARGPHPAYPNRRRRL